MAMYRIQPGACRLERFRSTEFGARYHERDLEDWLERSPEVLTDGEPVLIIGRQVTTPLGGTLDLLGLDVNGATVVIELKRAPTPRDIVAQAFEYATWVASLDDTQVRQLAQSYLSERSLAPSFEAAWQQAFGGESGEGGEDAPSLPSDLHLNERQRILIVIEGTNERVSAVVKYLRSLGIDIGLLEYRYYHIDGGEQILDVEHVVGHEAVAAPSTGPRTRYTEGRLLDLWSDEGKAAYLAFRDHLLQDAQLVVSPQRSAISFYKQTRDGRVYICSFTSGTQTNRVSFRLDSLRHRLDVEAALVSIRRAAPSDVQITTGNIWCVLHFPVRRDRALEIARIIAEHIVSKVE